jgi:hypothetical protein
MVIKMRLKPILTIFIIVIVVVCIIALLIYTNKDNLKKNLINSPYPTNFNTTINPTPITSISLNSSLTVPPNDDAINHINWSLYPNLQTGYVFLACVSEPNDVISYKFIEVQICTEIKNTEDRAIIDDQLSGVAREAKKIYGPDSSINIIGTKGGIARWFASILPFNDTVRF